MTTGLSITAGIIGLLLFFGFFLGVVIWVFRPGSKKTYEEQAEIPLKENDDD
jgi:cytochrome c oxidase cbb3-type subunit 4